MVGLTILLFITTTLRPPVTGPVVELLIMAFILPVVVWTAILVAILLTPMGLVTIMGSF